MKYIFLFIFLTNVNAGTINVEVPKKNETQQAPSVKKKSIKKNKKNVEQKISISSSSIQKDEITNSTKIDEYIKVAQINVADFTSTFDILSGTVIKARILNSVVSSNLESPLVVEVTDTNSQLPYGSRLICAGITKNKRVVSVCDKLVTNNDEYQINVSLLNTDGTAGLTGDIYTGKEKFMVGAIGASFLRSGLEIKQERLATPTGEMVKSTASNQILGGAIGSLTEGIQLMTEDMKTEEMKITINAGKDVIIYFNQRFKI